MIPKLTIILPVYNGLPFIHYSINSILTQSLSEFRLYIVNDGSTDDTLKYLQNLKDDRVSIFNIEHSGIIKAFNHALKFVDSKYVARVDADDVYFSTKFEKQINYLEHNENILLLGTSATYMAEDGSSSSINISVPIHHQEIIENLFYKKRAIIQSTIVCRTESIKKINGYRVEIYPEDFDLFFRLGLIGELANLDENLAGIRIHKSYSDTNLLKLLKNYNDLIILYSSNYKHKINSNIKHPMFLNYSIYFSRLGLNRYLNRNKIIGLAYIMCSIILSPFHTIKSILKKTYDR